MKSSENYSVWLTRNGATRTEVITAGRSQDFLRGGAIQRGDGLNKAGRGGLGFLRLHFERFQKLVISQTFNLKGRGHITSQFFRMAMWYVTIQKEKK